MSQFSEKIRRREMPSPQDWEAHLISEHAQAPRLTPVAFSDFRDAEGRNSYELLAAHSRLLPGARDAMDLACGDGHGIAYVLRANANLRSVLGVDMAPEALALARADYGDPRVSFALANGKSLPLAEGSIDHVFCHLALMLMSPLAPVLTELRRVLREDGYLSALVPGGESFGLNLKMSKLIALFVQTFVPKLSEARAVDPELVRLVSVSQDQEIVNLSHRLTPDELWEYVRGMYFCAILPEHARRELRDELTHMARDFAAADGKCELTIPMRVLSVPRAQLLLS